MASRQEADNLFSTQGGNLSLLRGRRILYCLGHQGSPSTLPVEFKSTQSFGNPIWHMYQRLQNSLLKPSKSTCKNLYYGHSLQRNFCTSVLCTCSLESRLQKLMERVIGSTYYSTVTGWNMHHLQAVFSSGVGNCLWYNIWITQAFTKHKYFMSVQRLEGDMSEGVDGDYF